MDGSGLSKQLQGSLGSASASQRSLQCSSEVAPQTPPCWPSLVLCLGERVTEEGCQDSSVGDQLSRLWIFVLLVLAQQAPSWSRTPGAGVFGRNMQVLLCLAQRILNGFVSLCEPCGQAQHGYISSMMSGGAGSCSTLLYPLHDFCPLAAPFPAGCRACTLAFPTGSILRLNFASAPGQTSTKSASRPLSLCVGIM